MDNSAKPKIVILGGGFAGMAAARALRGLARGGHARIEVWDRSADAVMIPALPDFAAGLMRREALVGAIRNRLPRSVLWRLKSAHRVDLDARVIACDEGLVPYDALIIAAGSSSRPANPDWNASSTYPLASLADAERIRADFPCYLERADQPHLLFSGGGYTAVELACALRKHVARPGGKPCRITLVDRHRAILPFLSRRQTQRLDGRLAKHEIELRLGCQIKAFNGRDAVLDNGERFEDVFLCRTEGTGPAIDVSGTKLRREQDGRLAVDPALQVEGYPAVFAAGDAAAIRVHGGFLRKAVNFAIYSGACAGKNMARLLRERPLREYRPVDLGWVIPMADDSVGLAFGVLPLQGRPGLMLHYFMCGFRNFSLRNFSVFVQIMLKQALAPSAGKERRDSA